VTAETVVRLELSKAPPVRVLLVFELVGEKFHAVEVDASIANFSAYVDRLIGSRIFEFDFYLTSNRQIGGGKQADSALA